MPDTWLDDILDDGRRLHRLDDGLLSAIEHEPDTTYDRHAALYDKIVGNTLYNRLVWSTTPATYTDFAATAVAGGTGPLLDAGCGSAVFTAATYRTSARPLVLVDRSAGMLAHARGRIGDRVGACTAFVHADLFELPLRPRRFTTVACHGLLHLFDDLPPVLRALRAQLAPGGRIYASSLVAETAVGSRWLRLLHRSGEAAPPRRIDELADVVRTVLGDVRVRRVGAMAFLTVVPDTRY